MKVPTLTSNRVAEGQGTLGYLQTPSNLGQGTQMLARAVGQLGGAFEQYDAAVKIRDEKTKDFNTATALNNFETNQIAQQTELKRNASPDGKDFKVNAETVFDQNAEKFLLENVSEERRDAVRAQLSGTKQKLMLDAYKFQYEQGDVWFREGVKDQLNLARTAIGEDPDSTDAWREKMNTVIDSTDLSEAEKFELRDQVETSLISTEYFKRKQAEALEQQASGIPPITESNSGARALIKKFESGQSATLTPYWDTNAWRIGHGSDTVTRADGSHEKVTQNTRVTQAEADADLEYRLSEREGKAVRDQLGEAWSGLSPNVQAALYSVGYNYGSLPSNVAKAARTGDVDAIATAVAALPANKSRRQQEAAIIRGESTIESDPRYNIIPFDDRVKMRDAAAQNAKQAYNAQLKEEKAVKIAQRNELQVGLLDGTKTAVDIQAARDTGVLTDYDDIKKANKILKDTQERTGLSTSFIMDRIAGKPYDPTSEDQRKAYNAFVGPDGLNKLGQRDEAYFSQSILAPFAITGAMATDVAGLFQGMVRGGNQQNAQFALDALAQMRDANPLGFASQIPEAIQREVDAFDDLKGSVENPAELIDRVRGGTTQVERSRNEMLRKEAEANLSKTDAGVPTIKTLMKELEASYDDWSPGTPHFYTNPGAALAVQTEFNNEYVKEYGVYGDHDKAVEAATKTIKSTWKVSAVGDSQTVMKYPPEMVGYKPSNGSYDWINEQVKQEFGLAPEQQFELISDDSTRQEWEQFRAGVRATPPSYRVMIRDANGVMRDGSVADGENRGIPRVYFEKPPELVAQENLAFDIKNETQALSERLIGIVEMKMMNNSVNTGKELPEEIQQEEEEIRNRLRLLEAPVEQNPVPNRAKIFNRKGF